MSTMEELTLEISQTVEINAAIGDAYAALIRRLTTENSTPDNKPMPMVLEEWPGGRWFRDLGNGQGHLWGFVQVIKPPTLIEIHGPMFMSYPVSGHIKFRIDEEANGCRLSLRHQALGLIQDEHREGAGQGWNLLLTDVKATAE